MRVHSSFRGISNAPATPEMTELFLIEEYHWTPKQIAEIPYKKIQKLFLIKAQKHEAENVNRTMSQLKAQQGSMGKGGRVGYREL